YTLFSAVGNMQRTVLTHPTKSWIITTDLDVEDRYGAMVSAWNHSIALAQPQHHIINPTYFCRALDDRVEHRLHIRRRATDNTEHLGSRRLMLQRLAQLRVAFLKFFEQSNIFDRDHGLSSESFH